jgi:glyoxylase-like metal-dependent hydrolase (beta-lactamase superfamily II)
MSVLPRSILLAAAAAAMLAATAQAQQPARPLYATTKVDGTDGVYTFRYQNSLSMFVVTPAGVIVTDPIGYGRPEAVKTYLEEIRKITDKPIKYVLYSHHHFDHIAGGKPFKDAGAKFVAHKRAKERLAALKDPHTVLPDETFDKTKTIKLGGTTVEMIYMGLNHSDATAVIRLPKEKIVFTVDTVANASTRKSWRQLTDPNPQVREYVKEIQLPTGSRQFHEIAAFLNSPESPIVRLQTEDGAVVETRVSVERSYMLSDQLMIAVVDTESTVLNNISSAEIVRAPNRTPFKSGAPTGGQLQDPIVHKHCGSSPEIHLEALRWFAGLTRCAGLAPSELTILNAGQRPSSDVLEHLGLREHSEVGGARDDR